jgi:multiple sugar transport system permease protein
MLQKKKSLTGLIYLAVPIAGFAVFYIAPFFVSVSMTFTGGIGGTQFVGLDNYSYVLQSETFRTAAVNTFKFIIIGVPLIMAISLLLALLLNTGVRGSKILRSFYILPLVLPVVSVVMTFKILFARSGVVNGVLAALDYPDVNFFHFGSAFIVLLILYIWKNSGYNIVLYMAGLSTIPKEYYEAAKVEGASELRQFYSITMPLLSPTVFFVFIMSVINFFKAFRESYVLSGNYPDPSIYMLQHYMNNNFQNLNYPRLSVAALITFLFVFALVFLLFRRQKSFGDTR